MAEEKTLPWPVVFKDPGSIIKIGGQEIHQGNLTQESYEFLLGWNKNYALQFVPAGENEAAKPVKPKPDGKAKETSAGS